MANTVTLFVMDHILILKERRMKAEARAIRHKKALEVAETEIDEIGIALRLLGEIENQSTTIAKADGTATTAGRQLSIVELLGNGPENRQSPIDLFEAYKKAGLDSINIDTFRTTIWRMKGKAYRLADVEWRIEGSDGHYWKKFENLHATFHTPSGSVENAAGDPFVKFSDDDQFGPDFDEEEGASF
jgi:hypothetical protein